MRLADFIRQNIPAILKGWEAFAATQMPAAASMDTLALRDHAAQILEAVAKDLSTLQSRRQQTAKSLGQAHALLGAPDTAAQTHAILRAHSGFDINQLAAEYRALRASVLRLWTDACEPGSFDVEDLIRFNEAIDQALAESVAFFSAQVSESRNLLLGMLGHDMRSPLQTIQMTASYLAAPRTSDQVSNAASRLNRSAARIKALLNDLLDFNRTQLGLGIEIARSDVDVAALFADEVSQLRAAHPRRTIELQVHGDCAGTWDGLRLQQLLCNLVENAIKYGSETSAVRVSVTCDPHELCFEVMNEGETIEASMLQQLFEPLKRGTHAVDDARSGSLGLGLYIAREIAKGHGGDIHAQSVDGQTTFSVKLPRR
jgi:signal transduction histidine kinase